MILLILWACLSSNKEEIQAQKAVSRLKDDKSVEANVDDASGDRIVAIGDLHADLEQAKAVFRLAGLIDEMDKWIDKSTLVVQTGDITDRGPDGKSMLEFIMRMEQEAEGRFVPLMGNHESMTLVGDWRYVSREDYTSFGGMNDRKKALLQKGPFRNWLMGLDAVAVVGQTMFVHGGISRTFANQTPKQLSSTIRDDIKNGRRSAILSDEGPLWYRGLMLADEPLACAELKDVLALQKVSRMVVGHTTQRTGFIASRCEGRLLGIDIGISSHYGANIGFLEILNGNAKAVYQGNVIDLPDPK